MMEDYSQQPAPKKPKVGIGKQMVFVLFIIIMLFFMGISYSIAQSEKQALSQMNVCLAHTSNMVDFFYREDLNGPDAEGICREWVAFKNAGCLEYTNPKITPQINGYCAGFMAEMG